MGDTEGDRNAAGAPIDAASSSSLLAPHRPWAEEGGNGYEGLNRSVNARGPPSPTSVLRLLCGFMVMTAARLPTFRTPPRYYRFDPVAACSRPPRFSIARIMYPGARAHRVSFFLFPLSSGVAVWMSTPPLALFVYITHINRI